MKNGWRLAYKKEVRKPKRCEHSGASDSLFSHITTFRPCWATAFFAESGGDAFDFTDEVACLSGNRAFFVLWLRLELLRSIPVGLSNEGSFCWYSRHFLSNAANNSVARRSMEFRGEEFLEDGREQTPSAIDRDEDGVSRPPRSSSVRKS